MQTQSVPTSIGVYHNLLDGRRFRRGFEIYYDEAYSRNREGAWFWRVRNCYLLIHTHGPFATDQVAWEHAISAK